MRGGLSEAVLQEWPLFLGVAKGERMRCEVRDRKVQQRAQTWSCWDDSRDEAGEIGAENAARGRSSRHRHGRHLPRQPSAARESVARPSVL